MIDKIKTKLDSGKELTTDESTNIAREWMSIADIDGSGTIDEDEFMGFVAKLEVNLSDAELKRIFNDCDDDKSGELEVE